MKSIHPFWSSLVLSVLTASTMLAGPYPPAATNNQATTAIVSSSRDFVAWATGHTNYLPGVDESGEHGFNPDFKYPDEAYGAADCSLTVPYYVLSLGGGGEVTMTFDVPITDGTGFDFVLFENAIDDTFLELAFVEVSSDGTHFFRFPANSLTSHLVEPYATGSNGVDPTEVDGVAGKYRGGYGTPFDLSILPDDPTLDKKHIRYVKVLDIMGDGRIHDTQNRPIYDPYPTSGTPGFDLDAIGVIHASLDFETVLTSSEVTLSFMAMTNRTYGVEWNDDVTSTNWTELVPSIAGDNVRHVIIDTNAVMTEQRYYRIRGISW